MDITDIEDEMGLFTLEDTHANLKDIRDDLMQEIDDLTHRTANNEFGTLFKGISQDDVTNRQHKLAQALLKNLHLQDPRELPLARTIDLHKTMIKDFQNTVDSMKKIATSIRMDLDKTQRNIAYLQSNKAGLEKMKNACLGAIENVGGYTTYRKEISITKQIFNEVKADLFTVVDTIFPENAGFRELLANFTQAYTRGGDDVYIDVEPENLKFAKFLIEADIAVYHRNDKRKIRMTDLL